MIKQRKTTTAILGGGVSGLVLAALLEKSGQDYLLIEGQQEFGGSIKGQQEQGIWLDYGMKSVPAGDLSSNPLLLLKKQLDLAINIESWTDTPQVFDKNGFSEFIGFGETKAGSLIEELTYYTKVPRLTVSGGWKNLTSSLLELIPESKRLTRAIVTKLEVSDEKILSLQINGESVISVERVISTISPDHFKALFSPGQLTPRVLQRLAKTSPWTAVSLDIATKTHFSDAKNIFIFKDTAEEDFYLLGHFISNADPSRQVGTLQLSTWLTLIDAESALDDERVSKVIKIMKKNIKKAFPDLIENVSWERLLVVPQALALFEQIPVEKDGTLQGVKNLYLSGSQIKSAHRNLSNALHSAFAMAERFNT